MDKRRVTFTLDYDIPEEKELYDYLESFKRKKTDRIKEAIAHQKNNYDSSNTLLEIIVSAILNDSRFRNLNLQNKTNNNKKNMPEISDENSTNESKLDSTHSSHRRRRVIKNEDNIKIMENSKNEKVIELEDNIELEEENNNGPEDMSDEAMNLLMKQMSLMGV